MQKINLIFFIIFFSSATLFAKERPKKNVDSTSSIENFEKSLKYEKGQIALGDQLAKLNVPTGFRFLNEKDATFIIYELWGNPRNKTSTNKLLGMIVPENGGVTSKDSWAFIVQYEPIGYVKDDDANKINYDDLLKEIQASEVEANKIRQQGGYPNIHIVGWAQPPFYDAERKTLHWAKEIEFGGTPEHTLNYDIRVLGRKGILSINAVGSMSQISTIKPHINSIINSVTFENQNRYQDFNPSTDQVAVWTIGSLVAGKMLAKAGFFAILAKYAKLIFLGIAGLLGGLWQKFKGNQD